MTTTQLAITWAWTLIAALGLVAGVVGSYFAFREWRDSRQDFEVSISMGGSRVVALDDLRIRRTAMIRLMLFSLAIVTYLAVGLGIIIVPPSYQRPPEEEARSVFTSMALILGLVVIVTAKMLDLYTLYRQRLARRQWTREYIEERREARERLHDEGDGRQG